MGKFMSNKWMIVALMIILALFVYTPKNEGEITYAEHDQSQVEQNEEEARIIVQYKNTSPPDEIQIQGNDGRNNIEEVVVKKEELEDSLHNLQNKDDVLYAEEDVAIEIHGQPNDTYITRQWYLDSIRASEAWKTTTVGDETITVAVIDTGVDANHADLRGRVLPGYNFLDNNTDTTDYNGHGTGVSGIIAAIYNNQFGISGVAGNASVEILPLKVAKDDGKGKVSDMIEAIYYAVEQDVDIINISMGTLSHSQILKDAVNYATDKDILIVASAGNDGNHSKSYPASYDSVISVGSVSKDNTLSYFSNYNDQVDLVAPGDYLITTGVNNSFIYYSGTSFSSAVVSGMAAFMNAANPMLTTADITLALEETATDLGPLGKDNEYGHGLVNLAAAVKNEQVIPVTAMTLAEDSPTLSVGETVQLTLQMTPSNATNQSVIWKSSNKAVAAVDEIGRVTAIAPGKATITVQTPDGNVTASVDVTVKESYSIPKQYKELESLRIHGNDFYLQIKFNIGIDPNSVNEHTVYILNEDGDRIDVVYQFESNNEKVNVLTDAANYERGKPYYLYVDDGVKSSTGQDLVQPVVVQFMWTKEEGVLTQEVMEE